MTYAIAKMRIWNPDCYTWHQVKEAVAFILSRLDASAEDAAQACSVL